MFRRIGKPIQNCNYALKRTQYSTYIAEDMGIMGILHIKMEAMLSTKSQILSLIKRHIYKKTDYLYIWPLHIKQRACLALTSKKVVHHCLRPTLSQTHPEFLRGTKGSSHVKHVIKDIKCYYQDIKHVNNDKFLEPNFTKYFFK